MTCRPATLKPRSPSWSNREWWRSQVTRSPCRPASGPAGRIPPPDGLEDVERAAERKQLRRTPVVGGTQSVRVYSKWLGSAVLIALLLGSSYAHAADDRRHPSSWRWLRPSRRPAWP